MKRSLRSLTGIVALLACGSATTASAKDLPNYNAYYDKKGVTAALVPSAQKLARGAVTSLDEQRGVPSFLWASIAPSAFQAPQIAVASHEQAARLHLKSYAAVYGVSSEALDNAMVTLVHDMGRGGIIVALRQVVNGVELYRNDIKVLMHRNHELVAISGSPHPSAVSSMGKNGSSKFTLSAEKALTKALKDLYEIKLSTASLLDLKTAKAKYRYFDLLPTPETKNLRMSEPARVKQVYFPMPDRLVPAYFVEVEVGLATSTDADAYAYVIAADDGRVLYRQNLTHSAVFNYRVWADDAASGGRPFDGPTVDFTPHPTGIPDGSYPAYFPMPPLIAMDGFNTNPANMSDPWLLAAATQTSGNNVNAYTDIQPPDGFTAGDFYADITGPATFDRVYDLNLDPIANQNQGKAAAAQIFYVNNWLHDFWYDSGFNEAAGNAQKDNYGRGGVNNDPIRAEAQDNANTNSNNANMSTPADGASPRMQMYVWDGKILATLTVQPGNQSYTVGTASFGPKTFNLTAPIILGNDGIAGAPMPPNNVPGTASDGCEALVNNVANQIVLVDRGYCPFEQKTVNAQTAGAVGIIIVNNVAGGTMQMPPPNPPLGGNIPVLSVSMANGATIKTGLMNGPLTATMFNAPSPRADGTIDNGVVAHEWGHYFHHRQVTACGNQQCDAESEGWGDYNAAQMAIRLGDNLDATYAFAIYAGIADQNSGYFGIRRFPYSTDMNKNPLTFKHIGDGEALPMNAPKNPSSGGPNSEVHNAGEIWAQMVFEAHMAILKNSQGANPPYTFDKARRRIADYIDGGLKMAPQDPTYTEQRDAILAAAAAADPKDFLIMAGAFAKRGAGTCAEAPAKASTTLTGVVEDFNLRPEVSIVSAVLDDSILSCDTDGILDAEEKGKVTVTIKNTGTAPLTKTTMTVSSGTPGATFPNGAMATFGTIAPFATGTAFVEVALDKSFQGIQNLALTVNVADPDACSPTKMTNTSTQINYDINAMASSTDDVEVASAVWTPTSAAGPMDIWSRQEPMTPNHVWTGVDFGSPSDASLVSPPLDVAANQSFVLTFKYRHQFEQSMGTNWDGGVIEVSTDKGMNWIDISTYGAVPYYTGTIGDFGPPPGAVNALKGRKGFVGQSPSWPAMDTATIAMGNTLAGQNLQIRFRVASDDAQAEYGWDIDDIGFQGITNKPFPTITPNANPCSALPVVDAGQDQTVFSGDLVTLDGSKSSHPKMLPLTFTWSEQSGPMVMLKDANMAKSTFIAPPVMMDTPMTFQLSVSDGKGSASATTNILVKPSMGSSGSGMGGAGGGPPDEPFEVGGCGCTTVGSSQAATLSPLVAFALLALRRRRRAGARA